MYQVSYIPRVASCIAMSVEAGVICMSSVAERTEVICWSPMWPWAAVEATASTGFGLPPMILENEGSRVLVVSSRGMADVTGTAPEDVAVVADCSIGNGPKESISSAN